MTTVGKASLDDAGVGSRRRRPGSRRFAVVPVAALALGVAGCGGASSPATTPKAAASSVAAGTATAPASASASRTPATGPRFVVSYADPKDPQNQGEVQWMRDQHIVEKIVDPVSRSLKLPQDIPVNVTECQEENAYYDPSAKKIVLCDELITKIDEIFTASGDKGKDLDTNMFGALDFIMLHEIGHGVVDLFKLPITGREEDVADQFAAFFLLAKGPSTTPEDLADGEQQASNAAFFFQEWQKNAKLQTSDFADVHSLNQQRVFNFFCWMYGADQPAFGSLVKDGYLPENRATGCSDEWDKLSRAWDTLLQGHTR